MRMMLFYAFLALGLLLDGAYLFRLGLFCAAAHETGHVLAYLLCTRKLPTLCFSAGGVSLKRTAQLSRAQELAVVLAGPCANFAMAAGLYLRAQAQASYAVYFLAAVSVCVGGYNLLPIGVLDGARLLQALTPAEKLPALLRAQQKLLVCFCIALPLIVFLSDAPGTLRVAAVVAPLYLLLQNAFT